MKISKEKTKTLISRILTVALAMLILAVTFVGGMAIQKTVDKGTININTYCENGVVNKSVNGDYVFTADNGNYFTFSSSEKFANGTRVTVCFDMGKTDKVEDDIIIAISTNLYELAESLFTE
jgi:hypothetical protein